SWSASVSGSSSMVPSGGTSPPSATSAEAGRKSVSRLGLLALFRRGQHGVRHHAGLVAHLLLDGVRHVLVVAQELLGVLQPLADPLAVIAEPGARFLHHVGLHPEIDQLADLADPL